MSLRVASVLPFDPGDDITVGAGADAGTATVAAVGTDTITIEQPLARPHASGPVYDHNGPRRPAHRACRSQ
jgi:hypothetical protein